MTNTASLALRYAAGSDAGRRRRVNEDAAYASGRLLALADGIGGQVHGEVASAAVIGVMAELDEGLPEGPTVADPLAALAGGVAAAAERLAGLAHQDPRLDGMGTTLTVLLWDGARFALAHIGDSRCYLLRAGRLHQLTRDHTLVQLMVDDGRVSPEQVAEHPRRSMLMRALQTAGPAEPDLALCEVAAGDRYLLCSDGLTDVTPFEQVRETLATRTSPDVAVRRLIELANEHGGPDNVTCVVGDLVAAQI